VEIGELQEARVSNCLSEMDFGISTTPLSLLGKSGSVAAMWEHGLPVIVTRLEQAFCRSSQSNLTTADQKENESQMLYILNDPQGFRQKLRYGWTRQQRGSRLPSITQRFIADIDAARSVRSSLAVDKRQANLL
jgi:hypothetical protein